MFSDREEPTNTNGGGTTDTLGSARTTRSPTETNTKRETAATDPVADIDGYPYDVGKTRLDSAREVMAAAGYGPDNRFDLQWLQFGSSSWTEMPNTSFLVFNMERVPQVVREAMAYVIDQDQFVRSVLKSRGEPAYHVQPPAIFRGGHAGYREHAQQ